MAVTTLAATALTVNAQALPKATYDFGLGYGGVIVGATFEGQKLTSDWTLTYGAKVSAPRFISALGSVGAKHDFKIEKLDFSVNPYVFVGAAQVTDSWNQSHIYFDAGLGAALDWHINKTWGLRLDYHLSNNTISNGYLSVTYKY